METGHDEHLKKKAKTTQEENGNQDGVGSDTTIASSVKHLHSPVLIVPPLVSHPGTHKSTHLMSTKGGFKVVDLGGMKVGAVGFGTLACGVSYPDKSKRPNATTFAQMVTESATILAPHASLYIDTADTYCDPFDNTHELEKQLGLHADIRKHLPTGASIVVGTKSGMRRKNSDSDGWIGMPNTRDVKPEKVREQIVAAEKANGGPVFLWQMHHAMAFKDEGVLEAALREAKRCVEDGLVLHIGLCNVSVALIKRARKIVPILTVQNEYSLWSRKCEAELPFGAGIGSEKGVLQYCAEHNIVFMALSPLGGLKTRRGERKIQNKHLPGLQAIAKRHQCSIPAAILACLLHRGNEIGTPMLMIPSARTVEHIVDSVRASSLVLTDGEVMDALGEARH